MNMKTTKPLFKMNQKTHTHLKKIRLIGLSLLIGLCYLGCGSGPSYKTASPMEEVALSEPDSYNSSDYGEESQDSASPEVPSTSSSKIPLSSQKLIKTGEARIEVKDTKKAYEEIKAMSEKRNGYIFEMNEYSGYDHKTIDLTVKVDYRQFETLMQELESVGTVLSSSMNTQDVTREYIDVKARIDTLKIQENTLKELLAKASDIKDLLTIETELQRVREEIESAQGKLNYLNDAVTYSTLHISLNTKALPTQSSEREGIGERLSFEFLDGLGYWGNVFIDFLGGLLWLLPFLLVVALVIYLLRGKLKKLFRASRKSPRPPADADLSMKKVDDLLRKRKEKKENNSDV